MTLLNFLLFQETLLLCLMYVLVREIHDYCVEHKMKLNPEIKLNKLNPENCEEINVNNFMKNSTTAMRPINVGNQEVE